MKSYCRFYRLFVCVLLFVFSCYVSAGQNNKVGFVSLFDENIFVKEFGRDVLLDNSSMELDLGTDVNAANYIKFRGVLKSNKYDVVDVKLTDPSHKKILSDYDGLTEKGRRLLDGYAKKYGVRNIAILMQANIMEKFTFTVNTQYGEFTNDVYKRINGRGLYFIEGSHLNYRMGEKRPLFSYMTAKLFWYDVATRTTKHTKEFKYIKNVVLERIYDNGVREKIYNYATLDVLSDAKKAKFKKLVYADKFNKKKLRDFYSEENGSMDEYFDMVYALDELTFEKYERLANFKYLSKSVTNTIKKYLDGAQDHIIKLTAKEVQMLTRNSSKNTE